MLLTKLTSEPECPAKIGKSGFFEAQKEESDEREIGVV
jgi:hypothetical protein